MDAQPSPLVKVRRRDSALFHSQNQNSLKLRSAWSEAKSQRRSHVHENSCKKHRLLARRGAACLYSQHWGGRDRRKASLNYLVSLVSKKKKKEKKGGGRSSKKEKESKDNQHPCWERDGTRPVQALGSSPIAQPLSGHPRATVNLLRQRWPIF